MVGGLHLNTVLCFDLTLRNIETRALTDGEPCTAIVLILLCLEITYQAVFRGESVARNRNICQPPPSAHAVTSSLPLFCIMFYNENMQATFGCFAFTKTANCAQLRETSQTQQNSKWSTHKVRCIVLV